MTDLRSLLLVAAFAIQPTGLMAQDAFCANAGNQYKVGDTACIAACHGQRRLARCDLVSGSATWTYISDACPSAMIILPPWPTDWSEIPAKAAMSPAPIAVNSSAIAASIAPRINIYKGS